MQAVALPRLLAAVSPAASCTGHGLLCVVAADPVSGGRFYDWSTARLYELRWTWATAHE